MQRYGIEGPASGAAWKIPGTATERWRRYGAFSEMKVSGDVISRECRGKQKISPRRTIDRRLLQVGGYFVYRLLVSERLTANETTHVIKSTQVLLPNRLRFPA